MKQYRQILLQDWHRYSKAEATWRRVIHALVFNAGFLAVFLLRLSQALEDRAWYRLSRLVRRFNLFISSAELSPGALVEPGLFIPHPYGVGIGGGCRIGKNVTVHQGVSLGAKTLEMGGERRTVAYPEVGDSAILYPHVLAYGNIRIGSKAVILGNSVVSTDVPDGAVYGGVPAREIIPSGSFSADELALPAQGRRRRDEETASDSVKDPEEA